MAKDNTDTVFNCPKCNGAGTIQKEFLDVLRAKNPDGTWDEVGRTVTKTVPCDGGCGGLGVIQGPPS